MDALIVPEFKVVMIGDANVGKTSIINRYYKDYCNESETPTIAASYVQVETSAKGKSLRLNLWDTAGHEKFQSLVPLYARTADALILVFDINSPLSFQGAQKWYSQVIQQIGEVEYAVLCANKADISEDADTEEYEEWAKENKLTFLKTSALTGENISPMFDLLSTKLIESQEIELESNEIDIRESQASKNQGKCC